MLTKNQITKSRQYIVIDENKALDTFSTWKMFLKRWNDYKGRSRRAEYWKVWFMHIILGLFVVMMLFITLGLEKLLYGSFGDRGFKPLYLLAFIPVVAYELYLIFSMFAHLALLVRRLHDLNSSGWWAIMNFIPPLWIILLILYCIDSNPEPNAWGDSPKYNVKKNPNYKKIIPGF